MFSEFHVPERQDEVMAVGTPEGESPWLERPREANEAVAPARPAGVDDKPAAPAGDARRVADDNARDSQPAVHPAELDAGTANNEVGACDSGPPPSAVPASVAAAEDAAVLDDGSWEADAWDGVPVAAHPLLAGRRPGRALASPEASGPKKTYTPQQRLLLLDTWRRSGLPAKDFAALVGMSKHTLHKWRQLFEDQGPAGLMDQPREGARGSRLPDLTRRTILMLKASHPEWGCQRISDVLMRGPALAASASAVARVLHEAGYEGVDAPTRPHPDKVRRFERAKPNQLWQTDLFTFMLKRQNRRLHLVAFMDDHSRFIVSYGVHASASTALVLEALEAGIASYGPPEEILTDNGPQYVTWRGKSQFTKQLEKRGIRQLVARPRRPRTLGKIERFWGTLWREFLEASIFLDLADARRRIGLFVDYYNLQRVHRGIGGLVPADRFFGAAKEVLQTLKDRVAANALELARHGQPVRPFYVTGQVDGQTFSVHAEGERLILRRESGQREEVTLHAPAEPTAEKPPTLPDPLCPHAAPGVPPGDPAIEPPPAPGTSPLDRPVEDESRDEEGGVA